MQLPVPLPEKVEVDLLARRPDLMAQIWRVEAAAEEIGVAKAEFYPNVDLSAFMGLESLTFNKFFLWASRMGALNPAVHLPIFVGGKLRANLRSKVSLFNEAVHDYNYLVLKSCQEVADQLTIVRSLSQQLTIQDESVNQVTEKYLLSFLRFEKGIVNYLNVLRDQEIVLNEELDQIDLQRNQLIATLQLIKALGGGYQRPVKPPQNAGGGS
jgi:outer membrane protein TolC